MVSGKDTRFEQPLMESSCRKERFGKISGMLTNSLHSSICNFLREVRYFNPIGRDFNLAQNRIDNCSREVNPCMPSSNREIKSLQSYIVKVLIDVNLPRFVVEIVPCSLNSSITREESDFRWVKDPNSIRLQFDRANFLRFGSIGRVVNLVHPWIDNVSRRGHATLDK